MKWSNLKSYQCPKCGKPLVAVLTWGYRCATADFEISGARFDEIVQKMYKRPNAEFHQGDNQTVLNNLGYEKVEEDLSDSPSLDY